LQNPVLNGCAQIAVTVKLRARLVKHVIAHVKIAETMMGALHPADGRSPLSRTITIKSTSLSSWGVPHACEPNKKICSGWNSAFSLSTTFSNKSGGIVFTVSKVNCGNALEKSEFTASKVALVHAFA
jgi:hypothetical protein